MGRVRIVLDVTEEPDFTQMSRTVRLQDPRFQ